VLHDDGKGKEDAGNCQGRKSEENRRTAHCDHLCFKSLLFLSETTQRTATATITVTEQHLCRERRATLGLPSLEKRNLIFRVLVAAAKRKRGRFVAASQHLRPKDMK